MTYIVAIVEVFVQYVFRLCALRYNLSPLLEPEDLTVMVVNGQSYITD